MNKKLKNWCCEPFKNLYVENIDGARIAPCCAAKTAPVDHDYELIEQPYLNKIRNQFLKGEKPEECAFCWRLEEQGLPSRRITCGQELYSNDLKITHLEINVNNRCNLACRICTPRYSTAWFKEARLLQLEIPKPGVNEVWKSINLSTVEWIHFTGGEPFLGNDHLKIIEKINNKKNCSLYYNTNGTIRVDQIVLDVWSEFKLVKLAFSIDDIEEHFEYQRYGAKWDEVVNNLFWYKEQAPHNTMFCINRTVSLYNKHRLYILEEWLSKNFNANRYGDPAELVDQLAHGHAALDSTDFDNFNNSLNKIRYTNL